MFGMCVGSWQQGCRGMEYMFQFECHPRPLHIKARPCKHSNPLLIALSVTHLYLGILSSQDVGFRYLHLGPDTTNPRAAGSTARWGLKVQIRIVGARSKECRVADRPHGSSGIVMLVRVSARALEVPVVRCPLSQLRRNI